MLDMVNTVLRFLLDYPFIFFAAVGYFVGFLFRNINLYKIIALFFILPYCLQLLIDLNWLWRATLPFLVFAVIGYLSYPKASFYALEAFDVVKNRVQRK